MNYSTLQVDQQGQVDWLVFNRPDALNSLSQRMVAELHHYFDSLQDNHAVRVVVVRGAGRMFCAGLDMKDAERKPSRDADHGMASQRNFSGLVMKMRRAPQPMIALLHGYAAGGGFSIALGCDVRIAAAGTKMNCAFIKIGLSGCEMGSSYHLPRLIGTSNAAELLYTGRFIDADRALRVGLVSDVVPEADLIATGRALADDMIATSPLGLRLTKEAFWANVDAQGLDVAIAMEDRNQILTVANGNLDEGVAAFLEKRKPRWVEPA